MAITRYELEWRIPLGHPDATAIDALVVTVHKLQVGRVGLINPLSIRLEHSIGDADRSYPIGPVSAVRKYLSSRRERP